MTVRLDRLLQRMKNEAIKSILGLESASGKAFTEQYVDPARESIAQEVVVMEARIQSLEQELRKCREGR